MDQAQDVIGWFESWDRLQNVAIAAVFFYAFIVLLVRVLGKRTTSQMNNFDWIITIAVGSLAFHLSLLVLLVGVAGAVRGAGADGLRLVTGAVRGRAPSGDVTARSQGRRTSRRRLPSQRSCRALPGPGAACGAADPSLRQVHDGTGSGTVPGVLSPDETTGRSAPSSPSSATPDAHCAAPLPPLG